MLVIRSLSIADMPSMLAIERQNLFPWTEAMFRDSFQAGHEAWGLCLSVNSSSKNHFIKNLILVTIKVVGYTVSRFISGECELLNIAVDKSYRRQGCGQRLLQHLQERSERYQVDTIFLEVRESNISACRLYEKLGFKKIGERKNYYETLDSHRENAIVYAGTRGC